MGCSLSRGKSPADDRDTQFAVVGFGDPVLDVVSHVSYEVLRQLNVEAGGCISVAREEMDRLLSIPDVQNNTIKVPGGSAANVSKCLAGLSHQQPPSLISFLGMVGKDRSGAEYRSMLQNSGVDCSFLVECTSDATTATCLCLVTPDGQRTMRTYLGAALELKELPPKFPPVGLSLAHFEGYCLYRAAVAEKAMRCARSAGASVSLDLASFEVVRNCWSALISLLKDGLVDVLFCNEDEAAAVCEAAGLLQSNNNRYKDSANNTKNDENNDSEGSERQSKANANAVETAQAFLLQYAQVVVISKGKAGCVAGTKDGQRAAAPAAGVEVVDTVGAGDYFSAGFLHAWLRGAPLQTCAECGCAAGAAAVQGTGAQLSPEAMETLRDKIEGLLRRATV